MEKEESGLGSRQKKVWRITKRRGGGRKEEGAIGEIVFA
jgi:hypothetical protein